MGGGAGGLIVPDRKTFFTFQIGLSPAIRSLVPSRVVCYLLSPASSLLSEVSIPSVCPINVFDIQIRRSAQIELKL